MTTTRFVRSDGTPAYLTLSKLNAEGEMGIVRLLYPWAQDFMRLWDASEDVPLSIVAGPGI